MLEVTAAIICKDGKFLICQRPKGKNWQLLWEFPGGKIEAGEKPENALVREIQEELNAKILVKNFVHTIEYDYPNFHLSMKCFECELSENQEITLLEHQNAKWLDKKNLYSVDWLPADVDVLKKVEKLL